MKLHLTTKLLLKPLATFIKYDSAEPKWGKKGNAQAHSCTGTVFVYYCFLESKDDLLSASAWRDLDRELKSCIHTHGLTHQPVGACGYTGIFSSASLRQSAFPRTAVDNSCHFTLMPSRWNSFIPLPNSCSLCFSFSEFILPLLIYFSCVPPSPLPFSFCIMPLNLLSLLISSSPSTIAIQLWQPVCGPLGVDRRLYKLNWTQKQLQRWPRKVGPHTLLNAQAPL